MVPLPSLQHLKRVKSYRDPRDGPRILLLLWQLQDDQAREYEMEITKNKNQKDSR
jgi:hypothetical protein